MFVDVYTERQDRPRQMQRGFPSLLWGELCHGWQAPSLSPKCSTGAVFDSMRWLLKWLLKGIKEEESRCSWLGFEIYRLATELQTLLLPLLQGWLRQRPLGGLLGLSPWSCGCVEHLSPFRMYHPPHPRPQSWKSLESIMRVCFRACQHAHNQSRWKRKDLSDHWVHFPSKGRK